MTKYIYLLGLLVTFCPIFAADVQNIKTSRTLAFIENRGQVTDQYYQPRQDIDFKIDAGNGLSVFVGKGAIHYQFYREVETPVNIEQGSDVLTGFGKPGMYDTQSRDIEMYRMDVELLGANKNAEIIQEGRQNYYENYYTTGTGEMGVSVHPYTRITYKDIYPNIDWVLYTTSNTNDGRGAIKYDFIVHPGGNPANIKLRYHGATSIKLNTDGSIIAVTPQGTITEQAPVSYHADRQSVASKYVLQDNVLSFDIGEYDGTLVIDPILEWGTYFGGEQSEYAYANAVDNSGCVYFTGMTISTSNVATVGAHRQNHLGLADAFLTKLSKNGTVRWATYYGGRFSDYSRSIAIDKSDNIYIGGNTNSDTGIATLNPANKSDAFIVKFDSSGIRYWGIYAGLTTNGGVSVISLDTQGNVYLAGSTTSSTGAASQGAHQVRGGGGSDGVLAKYSTTGTYLWSTYYGGSQLDRIESIITDKLGNVYIAGYTASPDSISTPGSHQVNYKSGHYDAFIAKFNDSGKRIWGTYFGGAYNDFILSLAINGNGEIHVGGYTESPTHISTAGSHQPNFGLNLPGITEGFLVKFSSGGVLQWGTYYGGVESDKITGVCTDYASNVYVTGTTNSVTGIATAGAHQTAKSAQTDVFLAKFSTTGTRLWGTYYGGRWPDYSYTVASYCNDAFITGYTASDTGISTLNTLNNGLSLSSWDGFVGKFSDTLILDTIIGATIICKGQVSTLSHHVQNGKWVSKNGLVEITSSGIITGKIEGTDTIIYTINHLCVHDTVTQAVTVIRPITQHPIAVSVASGAIAQMKLTTTGTGLSYQWQEDSGGGYQSLSNTGQYSGVTTNVLTINNASAGNSNSKYRCIVTGGNCVDTSDTATLYVWPLGINNVEGNEVKIYPNPVSDLLTVASDTDILSIEVLNLYGQKLIVKENSGKTAEVDMANLVPGIYIIKVNNSFVSRVVKE